MILGKQCVIAPQIKRRKKTSKYKLIDWIYEKLYGYKYESSFAEGCYVMEIDGKLIFRDQETYDMAKESLMNKG